jgi:hypothetical protein
MGQRGPPPLGTKSLILFVNLQNIRKIKTIRVVTLKLCLLSSDFLFNETVFSQFFLET